MFRLSLAAAITASIPFSSLSSPSLAVELKVNGCGPPYGGLNVEFSEGVDVNTLDRKLSQLAWANIKLSEFYYEGQRWNDTAGDVALPPQSLLEALIAARLGSSGQQNISTPIGSESFIADELLRLKVIDEATYPQADCGGSEIAYFAIDKSRTTLALTTENGFNKFLQDKLSDFTHSNPRLPRGLSGSYRSAGHRQLPIPPNYPISTYTVYAPSEAAIKGGKSGYWYKFDVVFSLQKEDEHFSYIVLHTENLKEAKRRTRPTPPSDEHFRSRGDNPDYTAELQAAEGIASFIAGPGNCQVGAEGYDIALEDQLCLMSDAESPEEE